MATTKPSRITRQNGRVAESESPEFAGSRSREEFIGATPSTSLNASVNPDAERLSGPIRPIDLKDYTGPLFVINKTKDMISHDDGKGNYIRIEPVYNRDHIAPLPHEVARHPGFQRLWRTGRIQVTTDPSVEDYLTLEDGVNDNGGILAYTLESAEDNDLTPMECLICQDQIFMTGEQINSGVPALCEAHVDSVDFIEHVFDEEKGRRVWKLKDTVLKRDATPNRVVR